MRSERSTLKSPHRLIDVSRPLIMGVINATPDSYHAPSRALDNDQIRRKIDDMVLNGVDILDIGGCSTRPGSTPPSIEAEIDRVIPVLQYARQEHPGLPISIDTYRSDVIKACLPYQIDMVNDISTAELDAGLLDVVSKEKLIYVIMHMQGTPENMQNDPHYDDVLMDILGFLSRKIRLCRSKNIDELIVDPGIGFGKQISDNFKIVQALSVFRIFDLPVLVGLSRKSFIYKSLNTTPEETLEATTALHMVALQGGAKILRVHDVKAARDCIEMYRLISDVRK